MEEKFHANLPRWLVNSLSEAVRTKEWYNYLAELEGMFEGYINSHNIHRFDQITAEESENLLQDFFERECASMNYRAMGTRLCQILSRHMRTAVEQRLLTRYPTFHTEGKVRQEPLASWTVRVTDALHPSLSGLFGFSAQAFPSRADLMTVEAREALIALLEKHPRLAKKIATGFLNQPLLGSHFRRQIWRIILANKKVGRVYATMAKNEIMRTLSVQDQSILRNCQDFIETNMSMFPMKGSIGCLHAMKTVLSFFHTTSATTDNLKSTCIKLVSPLVLAMMDYLSKQQPPKFEDIVVLVEEFFTLISHLPNFIFDQTIAWLSKYRYRQKGTSSIKVKSADDETDSRTDEKIKFGRKVLTQLTCIDPKIATAVVEDIVSIKSIDVALDQERQQDLCGLAVFDIVHPLVEPIFSGFLPAPTLLFIWDQVVYCFAGHSPIEQSLICLLSSMAAIFLYLTWIRKPKYKQNLNDVEKNSHTEHEENDQIRQNWSLINRFQMIGAQLQPEDIKFLFKQHFFDEMYGHIAGHESIRSADMNPLWQIETRWDEWVSLMEQPELQSRENQRLLRIEELDKMKKMQKELLECKRQNEKQKFQLEIAQNDAEKARLEVKESLKRQGHLQEENKSWEVVVANLERRLTGANQALEASVSRTETLGSIAVQSRQSSKPPNKVEPKKQKTIEIQTDE